MTKADVLIAIGLGLIVGALVSWNITAGIFAWGVVYVAVAILFGATEAKT